MTAASRPTGEAGSEAVVGASGSVRDRTAPRRAPALASGWGHDLLVALLVAGLASAGPIAAVWSIGPHQRRAGLALAVAAATGCLAVRPRTPAALRGVLALLALGLAVGPARSNLGATPLVVTLLAAGIADGAVGGWSARLRRRPIPSVDLAVPLVALAGVVWYRTGSVPATVACDLVALAAVALTHLRPARLEDAGAPLRRATVRVAAAVAGGITFLVVLVILYLPGALLGLVHRLAARFTRKPASTWRSVGTSVPDHRRHRGRPFAAADRRSVRRQALSGIALTALLVGSLAGWIRTRPAQEVRTAVEPFGAAQLPAPPGAGGETGVTEPRPSAPRPVRYADTEAGRGSTWVDEVQTEQDALPLEAGPVAGFSVDDYATRYTNVVDGRRRTVGPPSCTCPAYDVWLSGGSAAFGAGQRDERTIGSELVRRAADRQVALTVQVIAVPEYTLWQEYQSILARLARGGARPDAIVFYTGFHDMVDTFEQAITGRTAWEKPVVFNAETRAAALEADPAEVPGAIAALGGDQELATRAVERFEALRQVISSQLAHQGIAARFYQQSDLASAPAQRAAILRLDPSADPQSPDPIGAFLAAAAAQQGPDVVNLHEVFDGEPEPVFFDLGNTNERGASVVARAIATDLVPWLETQRPR